MVFFVEGDGSNTTADLNGTGSNTLGDWLQEPYPVIDDASIASSYQIGYFPTIFRFALMVLFTKKGNQV